MTLNFKDAPCIHVRCACGGWAHATEETLDLAGWVQGEFGWECPTCAAMTKAIDEMEKP
jgi:hypothetical protein